MSLRLEGIAEVAELLAGGEVMLLSGAGLSTESGIPDYRGPTGATRRASPMTYAEFTASAAARRRYWARSHVGWGTVAAARPNAGHRAVAELQAVGLLSGVVTQNVDGLHQAAGAEAVIELHGSLAAVICLGCGARSERRQLDERLRLLNAHWAADLTESRPDGDAAIPEGAIDAFEVADCEGCGGVLKPDVVFFGESVPKERVQRCFALLESSAVLLVAGSSLTVMSGYRFVLAACRLEVPVVIVNQGPTRGDEQAALRLDAPLGAALPELAERLRAG
ncbi:MAG TPA: NAD-dependent protein deacetylase [Acidimicrobiales bacterium]|nr:NAD-dependent protein deacetylase [Acidimicrobiales bacterium]